MSLQTSRPVTASFPSEHLTISAGAAIFHLATARVVLCYHRRDKYYFLPKGRRNANEETGRAAEREGYEESGYRNRLLPIAMTHRQPIEGEGDGERWVCEPVWTQLVPLSARSQYLLFWYICETLPENGDMSPDMTLKERIALDKRGDGVYEPVRHENTGVDEEEAWYTASLMGIEEACAKLRGSVQEDVVRRGWAGIQARMETEEKEGIGE